jgi:hypothetical protein
VQACFYRTFRKPQERRRRGEILLVEVEELSALHFLPRGHLPRSPPGSDLVFQHSGKVIPVHPGGQILYFNIRARLNDKIWPLGCRRMLKYKI